MAQSRSDCQDKVLCVASNNVSIRVRDVDRVLRSTRGTYLVLKQLHTTLLGSVFQAVEHSTGKFVVPLTMKAGLFTVTSAGSQTNRMRLLAELHTNTRKSMYCLADMFDADAVVRERVRNYAPRQLV